MGFVQGKRKWIQGVVLFLLAIIQYSNTLEHEYAWDDAIVITQNSRVQKGLSDIPELFENIKSEKTENRYGYRPIALLSFATDIELFGMDPEAGHRTNILLYALLCVLIFYFLSTLFPEGSDWAVFAVTVLFIVHPLHTEVVANIKSRDEILALIFAIGGLLSLRKGLVSNNVVFLLLTVVLFLLSFVSKESGITFCGVALVLPVYSGFSGNTNWKTLIKGGALALGALAILLLVRQYVYSEKFFQTNDWDLIYKGVFIQDGFVGNPLWDAALPQKLATAFYLLWYGVYRFFVPMPLLHDYSYNMFAVRNWSDVEVYFALAFVLVMVFLTVHGLIRRKPHGFGLSLYFITNSIYLHLAHVGPDIFAERYLFVPSLGLCIALLSLFPQPKSILKYSPLVILLLAIPLFGFSWQRNRAWKNNVTLLRTDLKLLGNCARTNYNYAIYLHNIYYGLPAERQPAAAQEILNYYEKSLSITDRIFKVYMDLGAACMEFGKPERALEVFTEASEKYPDLSGPFVQLGKFYMAYARFDLAIPYFDKAIEIGSTNADYYYFKGVCQLKTGDTETAIATLLQGAEYEVSSAEHYALLITLYTKTGDMANAQKWLDVGFNKFPGNAALMSLKEQIVAVQ